MRHVAGLVLAILLLVVLLVVRVVDERIQDDAAVLEGAVQDRLTRIPDFRAELAARGRRAVALRQVRGLAARHRERQDLVGGDVALQLKRPSGLVPNTPS